MKLLKTGSLAVVAASMLWACNADKEEVLTAEERQNAFSESEISASYDDLDVIVDNAVEDMEAGGNRRVLANDRYWMSECVQISPEQNNSFTITFNGECADKRGNIRSGSVTITRNGRIWFGGSNVATLNNYSINGIKVEGTRTLTNTTEQGGPVTFTKNVSGGKVTWQDGSEATRTVNHTLVWNRTSQVMTDSYEVTGTATGVTRNNIAYQNTIADKLVYPVSCLYSGNNLPVAGNLVVKLTDMDAINLNFGTDACDKLVTVSIGERSQTIDLAKK